MIAPIVRLVISLYYGKTHLKKHLIIVESPAKAKTIKNFLGKEFTVIASKGHIVDLPKNSFGIKIDQGSFTPDYKVTKDHVDIAKEIKTLAAGCETVYIATDEDREGEAIGYHIATVVGKDPQTLPRIVFHEITKSAITHALETPRTLDMNRVNAQQARRLLDRIVGYKLSPLLGTKIQRGLSAGRVQSAALKIVVDREREITSFIPVEYHTVEALFDQRVEATLVEYKGSKIEKLTIGSASLADEIVATLRQEHFTVASIETKSRKTASPEPFMTSTLQQTASSQLGFGPTKTMSVAQKLYEGVTTDKGISGLITYMRTDSLSIAKEASDAARDMIESLYGKKYLPKTTKVYKTKSSGAQEAHEAIRPTMIDFTPDKAKAYLKPDELKLYTLIYNRFIASQMEDALFETQNIFFTSPSGRFKASGRKLVFDGFYKILGSDDKDKLLPELTANTPATLDKITSTQHFTEPPARFSEASLIKALEAEGIGRPSTYAPTVGTLEARHYITIEKKQIIPAPIAFTVIDLLVEHFPEIVEAGFTASMEEEFDKISEGESDWERTLWSFYEPFMAKIETGSKNIASQKVAIPLGEPCPQCGAELLRRKGRFGEFIACSGYPKCRYSRPLEESATPQETAPTVTTNVTCDKCGAPMIIKRGRSGEFLACSAYPTCKNTKSLSEPKTIDIPCPLCGGTIVERKGRKGVFYGCSTYPKCTFTSPHEPSSTPCEKCKSMMVKKTLRKKPILECTNTECKHRIDDPDGTPSS